MPNGRNAGRLFADPKGKHQTLGRDRHRRAVAVHVLVRWKRDDTILRSYGPFDHDGAVAQIDDLKEILRPDVYFDIKEVAT